VGAIAAGNTVLLKPSEISSATSALMAELAPQYMDKEVFQIVNGGIPTTTKASVSFMKAAELTNLCP
jgi:aldehyde dehydrogenase (NAD+)